MSCEYFILYFANILGCFILYIFLSKRLFKNLNIKMLLLYLISVYSSVYILKILKYEIFSDENNLLTLTCIGSTAKTI